MQTIHNPQFTHVALACQAEEPNDQELYTMIDDVIFQLYGPEGLRKLVKPGDRVVIKTNIVCCWQGRRGEKGRGVITDPRIVRYLAEKIRDIIGWNDGASLKVVDACFSPDPNPSDVNNKVGFHWARLNRIPDNNVCPEDVCYDYEANGLLDGFSGATLVNLDALGADERDLHLIQLANGRTIPVSFPRFLRRKEEAADGGDYTDVLIGTPVFKNHGFIGCTGSLKLHYGMRNLTASHGDTGRRGHSGMFSVRQDGTVGPEGRRRLNDYLVAQHLVRTYDLVLMDCLTANRQGPCSPTGAVSITPDPDEAVDYILTNAIMASTDPVAIDTVESTLAGYSYPSIDLTCQAAENNVGVQDPAKILVDGLERFKIHRARLLNTYGPEGRYPLSDLGNPELVPDPLPSFTVTMDHFTITPDAEGCHHVRYSLHPNHPDVMPDVRRVDLVVEGVTVQSHVGGDLMQGEFTFRHSDYDHMDGAYVVGLISAWDSMFNCVVSATEFFIPPDGCRD